MAPKFEVHDVDTAAERRQRLLKVAGVGLAALVLLAVAGGSAWYFTPPPLPETLEQARAVVESPRFKRLSNADKQPYHDVIREQFGSLNRQERQAMRQENEALAKAAGEGYARQMKQMAIQYASATPAERQALAATFTRPGGRNRGNAEENGGNADRPRGERPPQSDSGEAGDKGRAPQSGGSGSAGDGGGGSGEGRDRGDDPDRRQRIKEHINDRMTNGDAQMNQLFGEMMREMRRQREQQQSGNTAR